MLFFGCKNTLKTISLNMYKKILLKSKNLFMENLREITSILLGHKKVSFYQFIRLKH